MGRTANGVRGIGLKKDDLVVGLCLAEPGRTVLTICEKGYGKRTEFGEYRKQKRGGKGLINLKVTDRNGPVVRVRNVADGDEILMISEGGMVVRTPVSGISTIGRATQGVRVMAFKKDDDRVAAVALIANEDGAPVEGDAGATDPGDARVPDPEPGDAGDGESLGDTGEGDGAGETDKTDETDE